MFTGRFFMTNHHIAMAWVGNSIVNLAPEPISLSTPMVPWWATTISLTMCKPKPKPEALLPVGTTRSKRSKILLWSSGAMPMPWSCTSKWAMPWSEVRVMLIGLWSPYLMPLVIKLVNTCSILSYSHFWCMTYK